MPPKRQAAHHIFHLLAVYQDDYQPSLVASRHHFRRGGQTYCPFYRFEASGPQPRTMIETNDARSNHHRLAPAGYYRQPRPGQFLPCPSGFAIDGLNQCADCGQSSGGSGSWVLSHSFQFQSHFWVRSHFWICWHLKGQ